jgi:hypothetical protein
MPHVTYECLDTWFVEEHVRRLAALDCPDETRQSRP